MYRVSLNVAISFYRSETVRMRHVLPAAERIFDVVDERESQSDEIRLLYRSIERLDPLNKALMLLYLDGYTYAESSEVLGISESNVATKIGRLKKAFKRDFGGAVRT
jgi:RNA polymerase sigma-70 factor (ECF subfamily)